MDGMIPAESDNRRSKEIDCAASSAAQSISIFGKWDRGAPPSGRSVHALDAALDQLAHRVGEPADGGDAGQVPPIDLVGGGQVGVPPGEDAHRSDAPAAEEGGLVTARLKTGREASLHDVSRALFFAFAGAGVPLLEMALKKANLEDIFIELTEQSAEAPAAAEGEEGQA